MKTKTLYKVRNNSIGGYLICFILLFWGYSIKKAARSISTPIDFQFDNKSSGSDFSDGDYVRLKTFKYGIQEF